MAPARLVNWLRATYARPQINLEWLDACCDYLTTELGVPADDLATHVEEQFLQSSLSDSAVPNTGLPAPNSHDIRIKNTLCEIVALTEIGHSAFSLKNVRQARVDKEDLAGLAGDLEDGEDYTIPKYPRSMLRFELSDGSKTMRAIEYRKISDLELGVTPLGTKIYLKDVGVRRGIIFLEPNGIQIKGYQTEELEERQDREFVRGLRLRMRLPEEDPEAEQNPNPRQQEQRPPQPPAPAPAPAPAPRPNPAANGNRLLNPANPVANRIGNGAPVVELDPEDLAIDLDYEDSYSIGDGVGIGAAAHDGDVEDIDEEDFEIDEAFLQDLEQVEQRVAVNVIEIDDEESQVEILSEPIPRRQPAARIEEVIDISD